MFSFINPMAHLRDWQQEKSASGAMPGHSEVASGLMQSAEARAGQNPREAAELRGAALAYLSVVR